VILYKEKSPDARKFSCVGNVKKNICIVRVVISYSLGELGWYLGVEAVGILIDQLITSVL
jgi:hypothetical protein